MGILKPYQTERQIFNNCILLDANEHYSQWVKVPSAALTNLNRYPDSSTLALRQKLAESYCSDGIKPENILVTSGSIEAIDVLIAAYKPKRLLLNTPTYDVYKLRSDAHNCRCELVPLDHRSQPQVEQIIPKANKGSMVVFISPNNPTGKLVEYELVRKVAQASEGMVVIDEAYIEFAGLQHSMQKLVNEYPNVIVLRTFSKAWGLAGLRLGYVISSERTIQRLAPYRNAYSVNAVALTIGLHALDQQDELRAQVEQTLEHKKNLVTQFENAGLAVHETDANFILLDMPDVHTVHQTLREQAILVRPRPLLGNLRQGLRITVGSPTENLVLFNAVLKAIS